MEYLGVFRKIEGNGGKGPHRCVRKLSGCAGGRGMNMPG